MKQALLLALLLLSLTAFAQNYDAQWQKVIDLENKGEFKKAAASADAIYRKAQKNHNDSQLIKAYFFTGKYLLIHDEDGQYKAITNLQQNIKTASPATSALLQSIYAEMLSTVYNDRRYNLKHRTAVDAPAPADYREWTAKDYEDAIHEAYTASIKNRELLYKTPLSAYGDVVDFSPALAKTNRPLYDFLAERYMDYVQLSPKFNAKRFGKKDLEQLFGTTAQFSSLNLTDTIKNPEPTLQLCRELEQYYSKTGNTPALQMAVLRRISYAKTRAGDDIGDALTSCYSRLVTAWGESPFAYRAMYMLAAAYEDSASKSEHPDYNNKALALIETLLKNSPKHDMGAEAVNLKNKITHKDLTLRTEKYLVPGKPSLAFISFRNVDTVVVSFYKIKSYITPNGKIESNVDKYHYEIENTAQKPIFEKTYILPNRPGYFYYTTEIALPPLEKGTYSIAVNPAGKAGTGKHSLESAVVQVAQLSLTTQNTGADTQYKFYDRETGKTVQGVTTTYNNKTYTSDENGTIALKNEGDYSGHPIAFTHAGDTLIGKTGYVSTQREEKAHYTSQLYLDRAIYRPGQTVYFKGIVILNNKGKYHVAPNIPVVIKVENNNGQEITKISLVTNEFGSVAGEFILPSNGTGRFAIEMREAGEDDVKIPFTAAPAQPKDSDVPDELEPYIENRQISAQLDFRVEEYKRPTFEITWQRVKEPFRFGDTISVTGKAVSLSGAPLSGAKITYEIESNLFEYYDSYARDDWDYDSFSDNDWDGTHEDSGETVTDAKGNFTITHLTDAKKFTADESKHYIIKASVTDNNGETITGKTTVTAGSHPLQLSLKTTDVITENGGTLWLNSENLNNEFTPVTGTVRIYKMLAPEKMLRKRPWTEPEIQTMDKATFSSLFPYLPYQEVKDSVLTAKAYYTKEVNTAKAKELDIKDFTDWPSGEYQAVFTAKDDKGTEEKAVANFTLELKNEQKPTDKQLFSLRIINTDYIKDGYVAVELRSGLPVLYGSLQAYVNHDKVYSNEDIALNGRAVYKIPIPAEPYTTMLIDFGFVWQNNYYSKRLTPYITKSPEPLSIEIESLNSKLEPGSEQKWSLTIKDKNKKAAAELLASMYDTSLDRFARRNWEGPDTYNASYQYITPKYIATHGQGSADYNSLEDKEDNYTPLNDGLYTYGFNIIRRRNNNTPASPKGRPMRKGDYSIRGVITNEAGLRLPGASLVIKGTTDGTVANYDGHYVLYAAKGETIQVNYVGYKPYYFSPQSNGTYDIKLEVDKTLMFNELEEVLVVGYGTQKKMTMTGAASKATPVYGSRNNVDSTLLRGEVAGITVRSYNGVPDEIEKYIEYDTLANGRIQHRDINSWETDKDGVPDYLDAEPGNVVTLNPSAINKDGSKYLYVVDGMPLPENQKLNISESLILSINLLTKPDDIKPYGEKGKNGVVVIVTKKALEALKSVKARKDFKETAFFYPQLKTDKKGNISFSFTTPESLTSWKLRLLAHNKAAVTGYEEKTFFTQKDLMVVTNMPRFLREGDTITLKAKITNLTAQPKTGNAMLQLFNAVTMAEADALMGNATALKAFTVSANETTVVSWTVTVPEGMEGVQYKVLAKSGDYTDGEENILPVLPNSMLVTESIPLWVREHSSKQYTFENLKNNTSTTLRNQGITLEYTSNPAWLALQSLPYLMEYEHECSEQTFARFYANAIAAKIVGSNPKIAGLFEKWRANGIPSKLEQNTELKSIILAETPWLMDLQSKEEQNKRLALLMDLGKMAQSQEAVIQKLTQKQLPSGGFPWFEGGAESEYITTHILSGFGHLQKLGALSKKDSVAINGIVKKALPFVEARFTEMYNSESKKLKNNKLTYRYYNSADLHYLYMRSFYLKQYPINDTVKKALKPTLEALKTDWKDRSLYDKALIALVLHRYGDTETAKKILTWLKGTSSTNEDWGMYWVENKPSWYCYQAPVETQALIIEAFTEIDNDTKSADAMKVWLLKQKQNKNWPTTKSTTEAVYALLMQGSNWLAAKPSTTFTLGDAKVLEQKLAENAPEVETGYLKLQWKPEEITKEMATLTVDNKGDVPGYGGFYWQYFEQLDKIKTTQNGTMNIKKELYLKGSSGEEAVLKPITAQTPLKIGDLLTVRIVLNCTEDTEYVHLKDMRAAGFEPVDVLSGQQYKDGLRYYQSTRDAATHFFFDKVNRGTYILEYEVRVNNAGQFGNGISTIQSMYAPEFSGHTQGIRISAE
jgi:uncharacterized protein YfaS (alpha-2-macroglobulin family)